MSDDDQISGDVLWKGFVEIIVLIIIALFLVFLVKQFIIENIDVRETEARLLFHRLYFSPNAISYYDDELQRTYPGIVDIDKFTEENINASLFLEPNTVIAANFTLLDANNNLIKTVCLNKLWYDRWKPRSAVVTITGVKGVSGPGAARLYPQKRMVLVRNSTGTQPATFYTEVIIPN